MRLFGPTLGASPGTSTTTGPATNSHAGPRPARASGLGSAPRPSSAPARAAPPPQSPRPRGGSVRAVPKGVARSPQGGPRARAERPHTGRRPRRAGPELVRVPERREAGPTPEDGIGTCSGRDLQRLLEHACGVRRSRLAVSDRRHRHGFSRLRPRPRHQDADAELPTRFREVVVAPIAALPEAHPDAAVPVGFEEEARFGPPRTRTRVGARRGSRPRAVRPTQDTVLSVVTAFGPGPGAASGRLAAVRNAAAVNRFLERMALGIAISS
jgi:Winged helix-turn helix